MNRWDAAHQATQDFPGFEVEVIEEIVNYTIPTMDGYDAETERHDRALTRGYNEPARKMGKNWAAL